MISSISAAYFSSSARSSKLVLPIVRWTIAVRSVRYSTLPALDSSTALPTSIVTVPTFGLGILPCGPRMRPRRPTTGIMSGVAIATSKSVKPSSTRLARSSAPTRSAPASSASRALSPFAKTATVTLLPRPLGSAIVPRSCSSAWRTLRPVRTWTSTDSSNFARLTSLRRFIASAGAYSRSRSTLPRDSMNFFPWCTGMSAHLHAHRAGGPRDDLRGLVDVVRVEVLQLALGDLAHLRLGDPRDLVAVRLAGSLLDAGRLLDEHRRRRRLRDERERAVLVDRDHDRDRRPGLVLRLGVERLAELHDVDAVLAEGRADGRRRGRLAAGRLQLDLGEDLLRHVFLRMVRAGCGAGRAGATGSDLLDLVEADLDRRLAAEDRDEDLELRGVLVDLGDLAREVRERARDHLHRLADRELRLRRDLLGDLAVQQPVDLGLGQRDGLVGGADEAGHAGGALDELPRVVVELHVHEDVTGHRALLDGRLLVVLHLGHRLGRDDDVAHGPALVQRLRAMLQVLLDLVLVSGVGVDDVPAIHGFLRASG